MGLETASFISGLSASWPTTTDRKSQGDDHLRLLKSVLQANFPNASKAFYFPQYLAYGANHTILATEQNSVIGANTVGGDFTYTLPTLTSDDAGFSVYILKTSPDGNGVLVAPPSGQILTRVGNLALTRVGAFLEPVQYFWNGVNWMMFKQGTPIGSVAEFDGGTLPAGWFYCNGSAYNSGLFTELFAVLGTNVLRDRGGRVTITRDQMGGAGASNRVTAAISGLDSSVAGATGGDQRLATHSHPNSITFDAVAGHTHPVPAITQAQFALSSGGTGPFLYGASIGGGAGINTDSAGGHTPSGTLTNANNASGGSSANIPPAIVADKIIRAC